LQRPPFRLGLRRRNGHLVRHLGYARQQRSTSNWRYFDDVYIDTTLARAVLADNPVLSQATIIETQVPTAWSDGSITANVNLGKFTQGPTAYLIVVDASGTPSSAGTAVTAGAAVAQPNALAFRIGRLSCSAVRHRD